MKTNTDLVNDARRAVGAIPEYLTTGKAARLAMRELLTMWDGLGLAVTLTGDALAADINETIAHLTNVRNALNSNAYADEAERLIVAAQVFNPIAGYDADADMVADYLNDRETLPALADVVEDFKRWIAGE